MITEKQLAVLDVCRNAAAVRDVAEVTRSSRSAAMAQVGTLVRRGLLRRKSFAKTYWVYTLTSEGRAAWSKGCK